MVFLLVAVQARVDGKPLMRAYTPVTDDSTPGHVDLLVLLGCEGVLPGLFLSALPLRSSANASSEHR